MTTSVPSPSRRIAGANRFAAPRRLPDRRGAGPVVATRPMAAPRTSPLAGRDRPGAVQELRLRPRHHQGPRSRGVGCLAAALLVARRRDLGMGAWPNGCTSAARRADPGPGEADRHHRVLAGGHRHVVGQPAARHGDIQPCHAHRRERTAANTCCGDSRPLLAGTPVAPVTYTVQRRDSLWRIAECQLGDPMRWREIWDLNSGREFDGVKFSTCTDYPGGVHAAPGRAVGRFRPAPKPPPPAATGPEVEPPITTLTTEATTTTAAPLTTTSTPPARATSSAVTAPTDRTTSDESASADEEQSRVPLFTGGIALATASLLILSRARAGHRPDAVFRDVLRTGRRRRRRRPRCRSAESPFPSDAPTHHRVVGFRLRPRWRHPARTCSSAGHLR